jgi:hypothetical protein
MRQGLLTALTNLNNRQIGGIGEIWLSEALKNQGYEVTPGIQGQKRGDLLAIDPQSGEMTRIEVKTARKCKDGKWRFTLAKKGHTDHRHADKVALLAVLKTGDVVVFMIPVEEISRQQQAVITSHPERYNGKLAQWRIRNQSTWL